MLTIILLRIGWLGITALIVFGGGIICWVIFINIQKCSLNDAPEDDDCVEDDEEDNTLLDYWYDYEFKRINNLLKK
jgi:hypothetical protein